MEGRKTKHGLAKEILQYTFLAIMVALTVVAFVYRADIKAYFAKDLTGSATFNTILHYIPRLIVSIEIIICAIVLNMIVKLLSKLGFGLTDKGKTLLHIFASLIKWIVIIAAVMWILSVWGVNTTTLLAGAGILALVIGLGAQSLIADVLAGIFIVLEGEFVVGDIVVIDGWRGKIVNIGIRTTQLEDVGGNVRIINNSEIKGVTNQTKHQSVANCTVNVGAAENLEKVEKIIQEAFAERKEKIPAITGDIIYKGVTSISDTTIQLLFTAKCYEDDLYQVQRDLNRELKLLLDRNNIELFSPPSLTIENEKPKKK